MKKWNVLHKPKEKNEHQTIEKIINILLENRGLKTKKEIDSFLNPKLEGLTLNYVQIEKKSVKKTISRIKIAIKKQEQIIIYGDYDVDGITASAILWEALFFEFHAKVSPYIPHRIDEGYGISIKGIDNLRLKFPDVKLIITVDNGIVANEAIDYANSLGIDIIITDHHVIGEKLPKALAIIHTTKLCGAGIAYMLANELNKEMGNGKWEMGSDAYLELAALGTIADLVPLQNANRIIVKFGLKKLKMSKRPGLQALYEEAGIDRQKIGIYEVGYIIAPRLNATGRMKSAMDSLRLLCTKDPKKADQLASLLGDINKERQNVMIEATKHARLSVHARSTLKKLLIVSNEAYPEGIIGLIAGRLVEEFYRPTIVISVGEKLSKGSVRSISGFNIIEFLRRSSEYFVNIGGHPMAAGFTIETEKIKKVQEALEKLAESLDDELYIRNLRIDCNITFPIITKDLYKNIQSLSPFGMNNPEPVFTVNRVEIKDIKIIGRDGKHLKMILSRDSLNFEAVAFGMSEKSIELQIGDKIDIVFTIDENDWIARRNFDQGQNGNTKLQLKIKDFKRTEAIVKESKEM